MEKFYRVLISVAIVLVVGGLVSGEQGCKGDIEGLLENCAVYVQRPGPKKNPSAACCAILKKADIKCACGRVTAEVEKAIDMNKVVHVAASCGKALPRGSKCGSFIVP